MYKSNLIEILSSLSYKEVKNFVDFVNSPFYNKNEGVIKLMNYLRKYHGSYDEINSEKEKVFKKIFHGAVYNDAFLSSLIFKLNQLAEDFITINEFQKNNTAYSIQQSEALLDRKLDRQAKKIIEQTSSRIEKTDTEDENYFYNRYKLEKLKHTIYSRTYSPLTVKDKPDEGLLSESDNLIKFFLIEILRRYRYILNKSKTVNSKYDPDLLNEILEYLSKTGSKFLNIKLLDILYKQIRLMLDPDNEKLFYELKDALTNDRINIENGERRDGITVLNNYCIDKLYLGKEEYRSNMHYLNKYIVANNLFSRIKRGYFEPASFKNIVIIALSQQENDWTLKFIEKYYKELSPDTRADTYNFCYSKYHFNTGEFEKSLSYLNKVNYSTIHDKFSGRTMLALIHYELNNYETLLNTTESFRKFIANDKLLTEQHKTTNSNFIKFITHLCRIKSGSSNEEPGIIKEKIIECGNIIYRKWLIEKADELINLRKSKIKRKR